MFKFKIPTIEVGWKTIVIGTESQDAIQNIEVALKQQPRTPVKLKQPTSPVRIAHDPDAEWPDTESGFRVKSRINLFPFKDIPSARKKLEEIFGNFISWKQTTGKFQQDWIKKYDLNNARVLSKVIIEIGHLPPFTEQEILEHPHRFWRYIDKKTKPKVANGHDNVYQIPRHYY